MRNQWIFWNCQYERLCHEINVLCWQERPLNPWLWNMWVVTQQQIIKCNCRRRSDLNIYNLVWWGPNGIVACIQKLAHTLNYIQKHSKIKLNKLSDFFLPFLWWISVVISQNIAVFHALFNRYFTDFPRTYFSEDFTMFPNNFSDFWQISTLSQSIFLDIHCFSQFLWHYCCFSITLTTFREFSAMILAK